MKQAKNQLRKFLLIGTSISMVTSAVPACFAQTGTGEAAKSTVTTKTTTTSAPGSTATSTTTSATTTSASSAPASTTTSPSTITAPSTITSPSATTSSPSTTTSPSATTPRSTTSVSTTRTRTASTADDFIPGSEVLPVPETTPAQSDEFVKKQKPTMDLAMVLYKNNEYKQALLVLAKLPQTEQVHYYTGLCYKGLGNFKDATTHFAWVAYYAKDPTLKSYAFAAIRSTKPSRKNIKKDPGGSTSTIYSSGEASRQSEELIHRIKMKSEGAARERERGGNY